MPDLQIKRIVLDRMERCSVCHHSFVPDDIHVISRKSDMWMMVVECSECRGRNFVAAVLNDGDPSEAQLALRRLSERGDRIELPATTSSSGESAVSVDDVLDMHEFLRGFDGDFRHLFARG